MRVSAFMFLTDETIGPAELAVALEERGFGGLWVPEHPHIPTGRATPVPPAYGGGELPRMYLRLLDPFVALTAAAAATSCSRRHRRVPARAAQSGRDRQGGRHPRPLSRRRVRLRRGLRLERRRVRRSRPALRRAPRVVREKVELMRRSGATTSAEYAGACRTCSRAGHGRSRRSGRRPVWLGGNGPTHHAGSGPLGRRLVPHPVGPRGRRHRDVPQDGRRRGTRAPTTSASASPPPRPTRLCSRSWQEPTSTRSPSCSRAPGATKCWPHRPRRRHSRPGAGMTAGPAVVDRRADRARRPRPSTSLSLGLLRATNVCVINTHGPGGTIHPRPVWVDTDGRHVCRQLRARSGLVT